MKDIIKKAFILGVGVASLTRKHTMNFANELYKENIIKKPEIKKFANELMKKAEKETMKTACNARKAVHKIATVVAKGTEKSWYAEKKKGTKKKKP